MKPPTLIDMIYKLSFSKRPIMGWRSNADMRHALESARNHRFVADERMSAFMGDLANEAFMKHQGTPLNKRILDSLRVSSRLPHETIWVEYSLHGYLQRASQILGREEPDYKEVPRYEGWLIQQHPRIDTACVLQIFSHDADTPDKDGTVIWTFPFTFAWCCDDNPLPWEKLIDRVPLVGGRKPLVSEYIVGMRGYERDNVGIVHSPLLDDHFMLKHPDACRELLEEWQGVIRRVWALLATIDHLPLLKSDIRQAKGFLARGRIRKFLDHQTITLNIPARKDTRVIARQAIALAHRKRHEVRGHWRDDFRHPPSKRCNPHLWESVDDNADHIQCALCSGRQTYIHKHERGDASLGYVTHDYRLKHEAVASKK